MLPKTVLSNFVITIRTVRLLAIQRELQGNASFALSVQNIIFLNTDLPFSLVLIEENKVDIFRSN